MTPPGDEKASTRPFSHLTPISQDVDTAEFAPPPAGPLVVHDQGMLKFPNLWLCLLYQALTIFQMS